MHYPSLLRITGILIAFAIYVPGKSQDTTWTQVFTYQSTTRDTMVQFPTGDHNRFEKILMYYSMRCKKGLVSTSSNRNLGCGEWDYSCNTNVIDSSLTDSLKATHPNFIIHGYGEDYFPYTTQPAYSAYEFATKSMLIQNANVESVYPVSPGAEKINKPIAQNATGKSYYIFRKSELTGIPSGNLHGLRLNASGTGDIDYMLIRIAKTTSDDLSFEAIAGLPFTTVADRSIKIQNPQADIVFTKPYAFTTNTHLVLEIQYFGHPDRLRDVELTFDKMSDNSVYSSVNDHYIQMGSNGVAKLPAQHLKDIRKEISVSFWSRGNNQVLPNNNSLFYATDSAGNCQLNVHLPWSNGRVFWDCGYGNGSFDRIDKAAIAAEYKGDWSHWVFTKNATTGSMKIYLNGALWHSGTGKSKDINIKEFFLGGNENGDLLYNGDLDDFCVWNKELSLAEINQIMFQIPSEGETLFSHLMAHYDMNNVQDNEISDRSAYAGKAYFTNQAAVKKFALTEIFKGYVSEKNRLNVAFLRGQFSFTLSDGVVRDRILNPPYKVTEYSVENSNLVKGQTRYLWQAGVYPVFNENGDITDEIEYEEEDVIIIEPLTYYRKFPSKFELLSFVTPYGIGLDFGLKGKTWVFDVTDYGPVLKDRKRFLMDKGGEWQEEMDIKFAFIKGTPSRPVLSVQQIWPADAYGYTSILNNQHLEPRTLSVEPDVASMKIRTVATGHGQEGEFIPRIHSLLVHNTSYTWQLWKECADNPVYPQGGTWVYDRAGWCPGAPSDQREFEIMPQVGNAKNFVVDYGLNTAAGDSRYIVNTQLVKYGPRSFVLDASVEDIVSPSPAAVHFRKNPTCANPEIVIKNNGSASINKVVIGYQAEGFAEREITWTGNIAYLETANIVLNNLPQNELWNGGVFAAWIKRVNDAGDEYPRNNRMETTITKTRVLQDGVIVSMRTNAAPWETSWTLKDSEGNILRQSISGMTAHTLYNDTIRHLQGCYTLQFKDSDDDGISFWANGDGNGVIRAKGINDDAFMVFQPDFGREFTFNFVVEKSNQTENQNVSNSMFIQPNPGHDRVEVKVFNSGQEGKLTVFNQAGMEVLVTIDKHLSGNEKTFYLDVSTWESGMYIFSYTDQNQTISRKFVRM